MVDQDGVQGIGLHEAIESIRQDLVAARESGEDSEVRFPVTSVTVQLQVVAASTAGGKGGFKVPVVNLEGTVALSANRTPRPSLEGISGWANTAQGSISH